MKNKNYDMILSRLSSIAPLFAKTILDRSIFKIGSNPATVSAIELFEILKTEVHPKLSQSNFSSNVLLQTATGFIITGEANEIIYLCSFVKKMLRENNISDKNLFNRLVELGFCAPIKNSSKMFVRVFQPQGFSQTYDVSIAPLMNEKGAISGTISMIRDVTLRESLEDEVILQTKKLKQEVIAREKAEYELMENQSQLIQASRLASLGEMASGIAHEINNPLTAINLASEVMKIMLEKGVDKEGLLKWLNQIGSTVLRIQKIVNGLRTISRNDSAEDLALVSLNELFDDVTGLCSEKLKAANIELQFEPPFMPEQKVWCSRVPLSQVLINLIQNSYDAIIDEKEKWIRLNVTIENEILKIRVTDSGPGISPQIVDKIFHPFFSTKEVGKGTGVGLSISKRLIEQQRGKIYLDPKSPNTSFVIEIPQPKN